MMGANLNYFLFLLTSGISLIWERQDFLLPATAEYC